MEQRLRRFKIAGKVPNVTSPVDVTLAVVQRSGTPPSTSRRTVTFKTLADGTFDDVYDVLAVPGTYTYSVWSGANDSVPVTITLDPEEIVLTVTRVAE